MAHYPTTATAFASPSPSVAIPKARDGLNTTSVFTGHDKLAALPTPPTSISPDLPAHGVQAAVPPMDIANEPGSVGQHVDHVDQDDELPLSKGTPLSKGALSGLDAAASITPAMLAKYHLPGIMLGNGPRAIRYVMGELTQTVPGFSRIPPTKARRLVVAALESRHGGGPDGSVTFSKIGWGKWDAHIKGSCRDSGVGSFDEGHLSPPPSDRSGYVNSNNDSGVHMRGMRRPSGYHDPLSRGSWTASSLREEDELEMDMDMDGDENEADKMSLDGSVDGDDSSDMSDDTSPDDWAQAGVEALRKASMPIPGAPRLNYNAIDIPLTGPRANWRRRPSGMSQQPSYSTSHSNYRSGFSGAELSPELATPEERAAIAALMSLGSSNK